MTPEASIITPVYNGEKFLEEYFRSIISQTFQNWECIIVDDGSTDNTLSIIEKYARQDTRISYFTIPNSGVPKIPRDLASTHANSEWIIPIDADDFIDDQYIEKLLLRANETGAKLVLSRTYFIRETGLKKPIHILPFSNFDMNKIYKGEEILMMNIFDMRIGANGSLLNRSLLQYETHYNAKTTSLRADEYDFCEILLHTPSVAFADVAYYYRQHSNEVTKKLTIRSFDLLERDKMLEALIIKHFGNNSPQARRVKRHRVLGFISRLVLWIRSDKKLSKKENKEVKNLLRKHLSEINKKYFADITVWRKVMYFAYLQIKTNHQ